MGFSEGNVRGITVNPPNSVFILGGQKSMTSFSAPNNTNYEYFALESDGTNFRLLSVTDASARYNGIVSVPAGGIDVKTFGAACNSSGVSGNGTDDSAAFTAADTNGAGILVSGKCRIGATLTLSSPVTFGPL